MFFPQFMNLGKQLFQHTPILWQLPPDLLEQGGELGGDVDPMPWKDHLIGNRVLLQEIELRIRDHQLSQQALKGT